MNGQLLFYFNNIRFSNKIPIKNEVVLLKEKNYFSNVPLENKIKKSL